MKGSIARLPKFATALTLTSYVTLDKILNFSKSQVFLLKNDYSKIYFTVICSALHENIWEKHFNFQIHSRHEISMRHFLIQKTGINITI